MSAPVADSICCRIFNWCCCDIDDDPQEYVDPYLNRAQELGYEGISSKEAHDYLKAIRLEFKLISHLIPKKKQAITHCEGLKSLELKELFDIFTSYEVYWSAQDLLCKYLLKGKLIPVECSEEEKRKGGGALIAMILEGRKYHVELLLRLGVDPNFTVKDEAMKHSAGSAPIHFAAQKGNCELVKLLCAYRGDINLPGAGGATPLCFACGYGTKTQFVPNLDMIDLLIHLDPNLTEKACSDAIEIAEKAGHMQIVERLILHRANKFSNQLLPITSRLESSYLPGQILSTI